VLRRLPAAIASADTTVITGPTAVSIIEEARNRKANLIVIPSHSRAGVQRWRLGSVADKVVRGAHCDTLVIGSHVPQGSPEIRRILLPLDGSELGEQAVPIATRIATALGAEISIVRAVQVPMHRRFGGALRRSDGGKERSHER
jgi:nucleotide-binding universal stress UspA family protein